MRDRRLWIVCLRGTPAGSSTTVPRNSHRPRPASCSSASSTPQASGPQMRRQILNGCLLPNCSLHNHVENALDPPPFPSVADTQFPMRLRILLQNTGEVGSTEARNVEHLSKEKCACQQIAECERDCRSHISQQKNVFNLLKAQAGKTKQKSSVMGEWPW